MSTAKSWPIPTPILTNISQRISCSLETEVLLLIVSFYADIIIEPAPLLGLMHCCIALLNVSPKSQRFGCLSERHRSTTTSDAAMLSDDNKSSSLALFNYLCKTRSTSFIGMYCLFSKWYSRIKTYDIWLVETAEVFIHSTMSWDSNAYMETMLCCFYH